MRLVLDDFGIEFAGLLHQTNFKLHAVKIDARLSAEVTSNPALRHIIRALVGLTNELDILMIAKGVNDADVARELVKLGCTFAQGTAAGAIQDADAATGWYAAAQAAGPPGGDPAVDDSVPQVLGR